MAYQLPKLLSLSSSSSSTQKTQAQIGTLDILKLSSPSSSSSISPGSHFALALINEIPKLVLDSTHIPNRYKASGSGYSPLNDSSPNWINRLAPKETILLDGCDYEHWLIVMEFTSDPKPSEDEMINSYVKTLASVVGRYLLNTTLTVLIYVLSANDLVRRLRMLGQLQFAVNMI